MNSAGIRRILKNSAYLYMTLLMSQGLRFIYIFVIARLLGAEMYGLLAFGNAWYMMFLPMTGLGLGIYLSQKVGKNAQKAEFRTVPLVASIRFIAVTLVASVCLFVGLVNADTQAISIIIAIYTVALIGRAMLLWSTQMFQAYEQTIYVFKLERIFKPAEVTLGLLVAFATENVLLVASVHALGMICQGGIAVFWVNKYLVKVNLTWRPRIMLALVVKLLPLGIAVALGQFLFQGPVVLLKQEGITLSQIGNFSLAIQLFVVLLSIFSSIRAAALPALSRNAKSSFSKLQSYSHYSIVIGVVFGCSCALLASQLAEPIIVWLFTEKFRLAGNVMAILVWALIPAIIHNMLNSSQAALEHNKSILLINVLGASTLIVGMFYWLDAQFVEGAAYTVIAGFGTAALASALYLVKKKVLRALPSVIWPALITLLTFTLNDILNDHVVTFAALFISISVMLILSWWLLVDAQVRKLILERVVKR
ncbi:oligosaccharide flippase family protein [Aliiglaciecola sp. M165]|uniref:oligosaccharide flippase family protein n=1 Tax=Aliiglaciecola sp. M165 TaxID=2593649 RepID=UPI0011800578|nr:oligosaccharide flippase family protein [Aliiglaciecola sp. M165]TRY30823.1 oligosaccharide flippase family protein [Aliiglaciecola sp. M165]